MLLQCSRFCEFKFYYLIEKSEAELHKCKKKLVDRASLRTMSAHILTYDFVIFLQNPRLVKKTDHCMKVMIHLVITQTFLVKLN